MRKEDGKYQDVSIHFTLKGQSLDDVKTKLTEWFKSESGKKRVDLSDKDTVLHHCFLSRKEVLELGFSTDVVDYLESLCGNMVNWKYVSDSLHKSRELMLENLKRLDGLAIFVGDIVDGVFEEYDIVFSKGVNVMILK